MSLCVSQDLKLTHIHSETSRHGEKLQSLQRKASALNVGTYHSRHINSWLKSWSSEIQPLVFQSNKSPITCSAHAQYMLPNASEKQGVFSIVLFWIRLDFAFRLRFVLPPVPPHLTILRGWCAWKSKGLIELIAYCYAYSLSERHSHSTAVQEQQASST